jgi:hypothetical protein
MQEALIAAVFLVVSALIGSLIQPGEDQLRPLTPQASSGDAGHDHHDSHQH